MDVWKSIAGVLVVALSGCGTPSGWKRERAGDWESPEFAEREKAAAAPLAATQPPLTAPILHPPAIKAPEMSWISLERWCEETRRPMPVRLDGVSAAYSVHANSGLLVLRSGSKSAYWEGSEVRLGFAPEFVDGRLFVHGLDFEKTID